MADLPAGLSVSPLMVSGATILVREIVGLIVAGLRGRAAETDHAYKRLRDLVDAVTAEMEAIKADLAATRRALDEAERSVREGRQEMAELRLRLTMAGCAVLRGENVGDVGVCALAAKAIVGNG